MTNNPRKIAALSGYGLEIVERVPIEIQPNEANIEYLRTKQEKLGHVFNWQYEKEILNNGKNISGGPDRDRAKSRHRH